MGIPKLSSILFFILPPPYRLLDHRLPACSCFYCRRSFYLLTYHILPPYYTMPVLPTLGTGVFIGASQALAVGGPASLLISYLLLSLLAYFLTTTAAEVATHLPARDGTLVTHGYRYASRHFGFSLAYLRWYTLALFPPYEITTAMVNLGLWEPGPKVAARITVAILIILATNFLPERAFRRSEIVFTGLKLVLTIGLFAFSIAMFATSHRGARGFGYWHDPGAMNEQLTGGPLGRGFGMVQCLLYSGVAFIFLPEQVVYRAEQREVSPRSSILSVSRRDSIQVFALYLLSILGMGVACPSDDPLLTGYDTGAGYSPYIVAMRIRGLRVLPTIATSAILVSSVASGRAFLFLSSRTLHILAENGHAPSVFVKRNRYGVPYAAVLGSGAFTLLAYMSARHSSTEVFNWLMPAITTSGYVSWMATCAVYLNFRRLVGAQTAPNQNGAPPIVAYIGMAFTILLPLANGLTVAGPDRLNIRNLVPAYVGIPVFLALYHGHQFMSPNDPEGSRAEESSLERVSGRAGPSRMASRLFGKTRANVAEPGNDEV